MATKIHVGFKDGKLTSGKCEATKGKCPYGNHFPSQGEADNYQEHVAEILYSPKYRDLAAGFEAMGKGGNSMTTQDALANGFPPEIAKLIGGEPTDPKYARENVGVEVVEEPVAEPGQVEVKDAPAVVDGEKVEEVEQLPEKEPGTVEAPVSEPEAATPRPANGGEAISHEARQLATMCRQNRAVLTLTLPKVSSDSLRFLTVTGCQIVTALRNLHHI